MSTWESLTKNEQTHANKVIKDYNNHVEKKVIENVKDWIDEHPVVVAVSSIALTSFLGNHLATKPKKR